MIEHSEQLDKLATALSAAQGQIKVAIKDSTNPHFKSRYADLGSVWDACKDALSANELSIVQSPGFNDDAQSVYLTTMLLHKSGQWMRGVSGCKPKDGSPQSVGSAITYLRRYGLAALLGVVSDDDDAESAQPERRQQQSKPQPVPAAKPTPQQATVNA
ncbi:MAG TPA: ERF family protein, partial [Blastocatellia bacterium]|nr:ERF family protein [Blastocatellia bacterium]